MISIIFTVSEMAMELQENSNRNYINRLVSKKKESKGPDIWYRGLVEKEQLILFLLILVSRRMKIFLL